MRQQVSIIADRPHAQSAILRKIMFISKSCIDLITEFEGLELKAYIDPVGIPTIGYGTIRYPDGRKVRLGDEISEMDAEAYLKLEADKFAEEVTDLVEVDLSQNQFDALVCFVYNVGPGAFGGSTLLKKLNKSDFPGAAAEFGRWNKGMIGGVKQELKGLTRRRKRERELFETSGSGGEPILVEESPEEKVNLLEGFRDGDKHVFVAWNDDQVVEIVELESTVKDHLIALVRQYPNAGTVQIATADKSIPEGERIQFVISNTVIDKVDNPPELDRILSRGSEGKDVEELQRRLQDLGDYGGSIDGDFGRRTDDAVREFQARMFGVAEADGKVGPITWKKLWGDAEPPKPDETTPRVAGKHYLCLTKTNRKDDRGLVELDLSYFKDGRRKDGIPACSGVRSKQFFRKGKDSISGSLEPLPEGRWHIKDIEWADGKDNYSGKVWSKSLGPVKIRIDYKEPGTTKRSAIEIHRDWNRTGSPGTAGCVGIVTNDQFRRLVSWLRDTDPRNLYVDWKLGTCPDP